MRGSRAALLGHPVGHSLSPRIHGHWMAQYGIDGTYEAIDVLPADLPVRVADLCARGYVGFNVTLPHKNAMIDVCTEVSPSALRIGAVNTVRIDSEGKILGDNTDAFGFIENLRATHPDLDLRGLRVRVLGAGGAARAVVDGLLGAGVSAVDLTNRTPESAELLRQSCADPARVRILPWESRSVGLGDVELLVNTTSLGMSGQPPLDCDLADLPPTAVVSDLVYAPLITDLLARARVRGNRIVTGLGMLVHQARPAFALWFGVFPEVTPALRQALGWEGDP